MVMIAGRYRCRSVEVVKIENHLAWAAEPLRRRCVFNIDRRTITLAQGIKLGKIENSSIAIGRGKTSFTNIIESGHKCVRAFEESYAVSFVGTGVLDNVDDTISSSFFAANSKPTCAHYIRVTKILMKIKSALALLVSLAMDIPVMNMLGLTHLDDPGFYIYTEDNTLLMIQTADVFVKNTHKPTLFQAIAFYRHVRALLVEVYVLDMEHGVESFPTFAFVFEQRCSRLRTSPIQ